MNVEELIEYLKTLPPETEVETLSSNYYGDADEVTLQPDFLYYTDYTSNVRVKEDHPMYGKKVLLIGDD